MVVMMTSIRIDVELTAETLPRVSELLEGMSGKIRVVETISEGVVYALCFTKWERLPDVLLGLASILNEPQEIPITEGDQIHTAFVKRTKKGTPVILLRTHKTPFTPENIKFYLPADLWECNSREELFLEILPMLPEFERVERISVRGEGRLHITGGVNVRDGYVLRNMGTSNLEIHADVAAGKYIEINFVQLVLISGDKKAYILHLKPYPDADERDKGASQGWGDGSAAPSREGSVAQRVPHH